ncbi:tRNA-dihydrouridine synthase [Candidatus Bipolaricaulota bacterium]
MANMTLNRLGLQFSSPIVLASGPAGLGFELAPGLDLACLGAVTTKTITSQPKTGNRQPRLVDCPSGALNSIGLENPGVDEFALTAYHEIETLPLRRILSLAASSPSEMGTLVTRVSNLAGFDAIELNLSCPNIGGSITGANASAVGEFVSSAVGATSLPVLVKLPGDAGNLLESCENALGRGAAGLTLINSVRGLRIDWSTGRPFLSRVYGGLSGPAILPISLARVYEIRRAFPDAVIIGTGGISDLGSALEMLMAGADFIGIGFGLMVDPQLPQRLVREISDWLDARGTASVEETIGMAHSGGIDVQ